MADHNDTDRTPNTPGPRQEHTAAGLPTAAPLLLEEVDDKPSRAEALRTWWSDAWDDGGVLHDRWEDLRQAPELGWHGMANWLKAALGLAGIALVIMLLNGAADALAAMLHSLLTAVPRVQVGTDTSSGILAVIDQPVRTYIAAHTVSLPITAATVYTVWQLVGLFGLIGGFARSSAARITWTTWGAASIAMVWDAAPDEGRTIATGLAVLAWTAASAFALRGLTLRPSFFTHIHNEGHQIEPHIHLSAQGAPEADDTPDNVHPLQKR
ncbi:hypothetical protein ACIP46_35890 [Streptomyces lavendulae]|uniref:hypothetical protein n=1 Tax=Streptomyces lavendulae TaxID=1914 RepID=UPI0038247245